MPRDSRKKIAFSFLFVFGVWSLYRQHALRSHIPSHFGGWQRVKLFWTHLKTKDFWTFDQFWKSRSSLCVTLISLICCGSFTFHRILSIIPLRTAPAESVCVCWMSPWPGVFGVIFFVFFPAAFLLCDWSKSWFLFNSLRLWLWTLLAGQVVGGWRRQCGCDDYICKKLIYL